MRKLLIAFFCVCFWFVTTADSAYSGVWTLTNAPLTNGWSFIVSDSSGQYLTAASDSIYISSDFGYQWNVTTGVPSGVDWYGLASSSSGKFRAAAGFNAGIYLSSNYGQNWTVSLRLNLQWHGVACSADFRYLAAVIDDNCGGSCVYYSNNNGSTWNQASLAPDGDIYSIACSISGLYMSIVLNQGGVYVSTDYGNVWTATSASSDDWAATALSSNGSTLVIADGGYGVESGVYISTNGGSTYSSANISIASAQSFTAVASDYNGQHLAAATYGTDGAIWTSSDGGNRWTSSLSSPQGFYSIASDSTGQYLTAGASDGGIYILVYSPTSIPSISATLSPTTATTTLTCLPTMMPLTVIPTTAFPSTSPSEDPSISPTIIPSSVTISPSIAPTDLPSSVIPSMAPSISSSGPSISPTSILTSLPPSGSPSSVQTSCTPTALPLTSIPTSSSQPSGQPSSRPSSQPSNGPTCQPTTSIGSFSSYPSAQPSTIVTNSSSIAPAELPSVCPSPSMSIPSFFPSVVPSSSTAPTPSALETTMTPTTKPTMLGLLTNVPTSVSTMSWNASDAPISGWTAIATSSSGKFCVAVTSGGVAYYSMQYGYYWSRSNSESLDWLSVSSDISGQFVVGGTKSTGLYYSGDYGISWVGANKTASEVWTSICGSDTGQIFYAATESGGIWSSNDFGVNWTPLMGSTNITWKSITCDSAGVNIAAVGKRGIYVSFNGGVDWNLSSDSQSFVAESIASNATGQFVVASGDLGIYQSHNFGINWTAYGAPVLGLSWSHISISSSGQYQAVISSSADNVFYSTDFGRSWATCLGVYVWNTVAIDSSGLMIYSAVLGGTIYVGNDNTSLVIAAISPSVSPTLASNSNSASSSSNLAFSSDKIGSVLVCIPGVVVLVARSALLFARQGNGFSDWVLNQLNNNYWEVFETSFKAVNVVLSFNILFNAYANNDTTTAALLVLSRAIIGVVWLLFVGVLLLPVRRSSYNLYLYLCTKIIEEKRTISCLGLSIPMRLVCLAGLIGGMFDVTVLRLLPWSRSDFTDKIQGYPNLFTVRCCLYGTFASTLCQTVSSLAELARMRNSSSIFFLLFSVFNLILALLSAVLFLQIASTMGIKVALIKHCEDKDTVEDIEMRETLSPVVTKLPEKNDEIIPEAELDVCNPIYIESTIASAVVESKKQAPDEYDEALFGAKVKYADETMEILKEQLTKKGVNPLEYIPLAELKLELENIFAAVNNEEPYDEARLDYLLTCMEYNPEYKQQKEEEDRLWRALIDAFSEEALQTMKGFIPPSIFQCSLASLKTECHYSTELAKRLFLKKCLWLVRVDLSDIQKIHIAELQGKFNPQGQGLDIVELAAIYAAIPHSFGKDHKKEAWRLSIEKQLKDMDKERSGNKLSAAKMRHPAYKNQVPLYENRNTMHEMSTVSGDAFKARDSFLYIGKGRNRGSSTVATEEGADRLKSVDEMPRSSLQVSGEFSQKLTDNLLARFNM